MSAPSHQPLYRTLFREALSQAWHHPRLWLLGGFASLLMTGGIYDVLIRSLNEMGESAAILLTNASPVSQGLGAWVRQPLSDISSFSDALSTLGHLPSFLFAVILVLAFCALSVIAQGALVYSLGIRHQGAIPTLRSSLAVGGRFFWKVALLNLVTLSLLWFFRTLVLVPFMTPLEETTTLTIVASISTYILYVLAVIFLTSTHMLGLTSLVLQKYSITESLARGAVQSFRSKLLILELGLGFFLLGVVLFLGLALTYAVAGVPLVILALSAALLQSNWIADTLITLFLSGALIAFIAFGSFATTVQYAAWNSLALRVSQGTALSKLHRLFFSRSRSS